MGYAIKNAATVAVTLALGSVLVACGGGGASQTETHQEPPGGILNTLSIEGEWFRCVRTSVGSQKISFSLSKTGPSELEQIGYDTEYSGPECQAADAGKQTAMRGKLTLQGGVLVEDVGTSAAVGFRFEGPTPTELGWGKLIVVDTGMMKLSREFNSSAIAAYPPDTDMLPYVRQP